jgi:transcriptional regulator
MYVPDEFAATDTALLRRFIRSFPFATVITVGPGEPRVSHLPLLLAEGEPAVLRGHVARANPQLADVEGRLPVLAIFHGPHGYVSPSSYAHHPSVPTWNYAVVHAHGTLKPLGDDGLAQLLEDSVATFEGEATRAQGELAAPWKLDLPEKYRAGMTAKICGFEIEIARLEGKMKLSQNKSGEDQLRVIERLELGDAPSRELAAFMRRVLMT